MRNKSSLVLCAVALTAGVCPIARAASLPASLQARYTALIAALEKGDLKTYDALYTPDYVSVDPSGKTTQRAAYMAEIKDLMKGAKKVVFHIKYTAVKTHDGIAEVSFDCDGQILKKEGATTFHEIGTDSWRKIGKVWMEFKTVDKLFTVMMPKPKPGTK